MTGLLSGVGWGVREQTQCPLHGAVAGTTSLILLKVSTSRRSEQGGAIYSWDSALGDPDDPLSSLLLSIKKSHCLNSFAPEPFFSLSKSKTLPEADKDRQTDF